MRRLLPLLVAALISGADPSAPQPGVDARGITSKTRIEEIIGGHLVELNGKFKLRASEVTFAPGAELSMHHHAGPGIRYVLSGKVTFTQGGTATIYQAGDYFYESGAIVHTAENKTTSPVRVVFFEILAADWNGPSVIPPKAY